MSYVEAGRASGWCAGAGTALVGSHQQVANIIDQWRHPAPGRSFAAAVPFGAAPATTAQPTTAVAS